MSRRETMGRLLCPACADELDEPASDYLEGGMTLDPDEPVVCASCGIDLPCTPIEIPEPEYDPVEVPFSARVKCHKCQRKYKKPRVNK
jgi:hypothetical protein